MNYRTSSMFWGHGSEIYWVYAVLAPFLIPVSQQQFEGGIEQARVFKAELFLNRDEVTSGLYEGDVIGRRLFGDTQVPHGFGTIYYFTTDKFHRSNYTGQWKNGTRDGNGTTHFKDGALYKGNYKEGSEHGIGFIQYPNGNTLDAEFRSGKIHGHGVFRYGNGDQREGLFNENILDGQVVFTRINGEMVLETWIHGKKVEDEQQELRPLSNTAFKEGINLKKLMDAIRQGDKGIQFGRVPKSTGNLSEDDISKLGDDARNHHKNWSLAIFRLVNK